MDVKVDTKWQSRHKNDTSEVVVFIGLNRDLCRYVDFEPRIEKKK